MRYRHLVAERGLDALVLVLAVVAQIEIWAGTTQTPRAITAPAALLWTLPLLFRHRFPVGAPAVVFATLAAESFAPGDAVTSSQANGLALITAFGIAGTAAPLRSAVTAAALGYALVTVVVVVERPPPSGTWPIFVVGAASWVIGRALAEWARRAERLEQRARQLEREQESAVAQERARIARELHDVIAHSVSVMTVQAGAARLLLDEQPERAREPLRSVEETGRQALADMRRLLGILRDVEERAELAPQPGMADVRALVDQVRSAGLPAELTVEGEPQALPPGVDLTAYRVVQEALTNALKHARPTRANVEVRYGRERLELEVTNDGHVAPDGRPGHGIVGMRERVALYGGTFDAGPADGGYRVRAALPLHPAES